MNRASALGVAVLLGVLLLAVTPSAHAASVANVQSGSLTVTSAGTTVVNISAVDPARAVLFFSTRHASTSAADSLLRGRLASANTLEFASAGAGPITVQWYLAQYAYGVQVQRGALLQTAAALSVPITPVAALDQAFLTWSKSAAPGDLGWDADDPVVGQLSALDTLQFRANQANPAHMIWWQLVEYTDPADIDVQRGSTSMPDGKKKLDVPIAPVQKGRSFALVGFRMDGSGPDIENRMLGAEIKGGDRLRIDREDDELEVTEITWQVVELFDGTTVESGKADIKKNRTTEVENIAVVDPTRALAFATVQAAGGQSLGRTKHKDDDMPGVASATLSIGPGELTLTRGPALDKAEIHWHVVEFNQGPPILGSFEIVVAPGASTCVPSSVVVRALDTLGAPLTDYTGSAELSTSTTHGNWSVTTGGGPLTPDPDSDDDGAASYGFVAADLGEVTLALANAHADDLTITVTDTTAGVSSSSVLVSFRDNAFVITNDEFAYPVAGRDHAFSATLWQRDASQPNPGCRIATAYDGSMSLEGWYAAGASHPAGAVAPSLTQGAGVFALGAGAGAPLPLTLDFANGTAGFALRSADVGQYALGLRDTSGVFATATLSGESPEQTVRPFGIAVTAIAAALPNPGTTTPAGAIFALAGATFRAQFTGVLYQAGDPLDASGNPTSWVALEDNAPAPAFAWDTALGGLLNTPATGVAGALDRPGGALVGAAEYAGGAAPVADLRYAEVGSMLIDASAGDYLGVPGLQVRGRSQPVGRFTPAAFTLLPNAPTWDAACTAFTYLGQAFDYSVGNAPQITLTAVNALGATTANYFDFGAAEDWWRLGDIVETYRDPGAVDPQYTGAGPSHNSTAVPTGNGVVDVTFVGTLTYPKILPYAAGLGVAPFVAAPLLEFSVVDADGVAWNGGATFSLPLAEAAAQDAVRHGRLHIGSAHGAELLDLSAPLDLQYFDGTNFVLDPDDACTTVAVGDFDYSGPPAPGGVSPFVAGRGSLDFSCSLATPCPLGFVDITGRLAAAGRDWLRYDWDANGAEEEPRGRVTFGIYSGNQRQIYLREVY